MWSWSTLLLVLVLVVLISYATLSVAGFTDYIFVPWQPRRWGWRRWRPWWRPVGPVRYVTYIEPFQSGKDDKFINHIDALKPEGAKSTVFDNTPYHLLGDEIPPVEPERISCVNSRSCYAASFDRFLEKTGNLRQITNNYKRGYPDSCSAPSQELVLSFYKTEPLDMQRPTNCL
jgi:hypothetical protein